MSERRHLIGLLLGAEEDWPAVFEHLVSRLEPITRGGATHSFATERVTNEPFDLRADPRYALVIDRLGWWYDLPREWLKKAALKDDVYLLNNPFTFQAMEKHSAYVAMMRLGLKVPDTWLIPHKVPPANERFAYMAQKYNLPFDLEQIAQQIGYPLYMKPFDGGQWVGVTRIADSDELHARYDESGQRLMHLQAALEDFEVFARSRSDLDITRPAEVSSAFSDVRPDVVVNCAAFTKVDAAETDPAMAGCHSRAGVPCTRRTPGTPFARSGSGPAKWSRLRMAAARSGPGPSRGKRTAVPFSISNP